MEVQSLITSMEMWFAAFSLIAAACLIAGKEEKPKSCKRLVALLLSNTIYMSTESLSWMFDGYAGRGGHLLVVLSNFLAYFTQYAMFAVLAFFIRSVIREKGRNRTKKHKRGNGAFFILALVIAAEVPLLISQFTNWYYYVDSDNFYQRGELFMHSQVLGGVLFIAMFIFLFWYIKELSKVTIIAMAIFLVSPLIALVYQYFHYGFSFVGIATTMSVLFLFIAYEMDTQRELEKVKKQQMKELKYKF